jgi:hypothetical protein
MFIALPDVTKDDDIFDHGTKCKLETARGLNRKTNGRPLITVAMPARLRRLAVLKSTNTALQPENSAVLGGTILTQFFPMPAPKKKKGRRTVR